MVRVIIKYTPEELKTLSDSSANVDEQVRLYEQIESAINEQVWLQFHQRFKKVRDEYFRSLILID